MVKREPARAEVVKALFQHSLLEARIEGCSLKNLRFGALYILLSSQMLDSKKWFA